MQNVQEMNHFSETGSVRSVLIVEDDEGLRKLIEKTLHRSGFQAAGVSTGAEALEHVRRNQHLVLLVDQKLPDTTGSELVTSLVEQGLEVPFIFMTGQGDERLAVEMMKLGADDYLVKDINLMELLPGSFERLFSKLETEQRLQAAENALRESESKYRELVENSNSIILRMDKEGRLLYFNKYAESFFGYSREEVLGKNVVGTIVPPLDSHNRDLSAMIRDIAVHPERYASNENENMRRDGSRVWVSWSNRVVVGDRGMAQILCIGNDVTARKKAEQELVQAKVQAEAASRAKSEFLANMSHEIRTPLNGIMGVMQILKMTELDSEQQRLVELSITSADRLTRLLSDILDLSRVEAGKMDIHEAEFEVREVCDSVSELFAVTAGDKEIVLECSIDPDFPCQVLGDAARVRQILFNLVGNALKFTPKGRVRVDIVSFAAGKSGQLRALFSVSDTGIGIADDEIGNLFYPFSQANGSYTRVYQGAGLGLAIVRRLVELMGGNIAVESTVGKGTTVHVVLPFSLPSAMPASAARTADRGAKKKQALRVLLVEDDPSNSLPTRKLLENAGHSTVLAEDGQEAVELFRTGDFDCVLMDIQMPVMDGIEATRHIRAAEDTGQRTKDPERKTDEEMAGVDSVRQQSSGLPHQTRRRTPIIALTAYAMAGDREKFMAAGMDDYLVKPVGMQDLEMALSRICDAPQKPVSGRGK